MRREVFKRVLGLTEALATMYLPLTLTSEDFPKQEYLSGKTNAMWRKREKQNYSENMKCKYIFMMSDEMFRFNSRKNEENVCSAPFSRVETHFTSHPRHHFALFLHITICSSDNNFQSILPQKHHPVK
jgi:hypothetical protein